MKNIIKRNTKVIIAFILGAVIFGGVGTVLAYNIFANQIGYTPEWKALDGSDITNVEQAINEIYNKTSTYKNLKSNTTVNANNLLTGETAYDNLGNLITGSYTPPDFSFYSGSSPSNTTWSNNYTLEVGKYYIFATYNGTANDVTVTGAQKINYNQIIWMYEETSVRKKVYLGIIKVTSSNVSFSKDVNVALLGEE